VPIHDEKPAERADGLWEKLGERTIDVMADGCFCLAQLWDSAWEEGGGDTSITRFDAMDEATLESLYRNADFLHSYTLDTISPALQGDDHQTGGERRKSDPGRANDEPAPSHRRRRDRRTVTA
jgi:hypothetical protein